MYSGLIICADTTMAIQNVVYIIYGDIEPLELVVILQGPTVLSAISREAYVRFQGWS